MSIAITLLGVAAIVALTAVSAFFSSSELAVFSVARHRVDALVAEQVPGSEALAALRADPHRFLVTALVSNGGGVRDARRTDRRSRRSAPCRGRPRRAGGGGAHRRRGDPDANETRPRRVSPDRRRRRTGVVGLGGSDVIGPGGSDVVAVIERRIGRGVSRSLDGTHGPDRVPF